MEEEPDPAAAAIARLKAEGRTARGVTRKAVLVGALLFAQRDRVAFLAGAGILLVALAIRLWSKGCLRRTRQVVTGGPYALHRHPFYLGNLLTDAALLVMAGLPLAAPVYAIVFLLVYRGTVAGEERVLAELHGDAWAAYRAAVPALFPRLLPWRGRTPAPFSFRMALAEKEVSRGLRLLAYPLLLLARLEAVSGWTPRAPGALGWIAGSAALLLLAASAVVHRWIERRVAEQLAQLS